MNIQTTTVPTHFTDILALVPPQVAPDRFAHRVLFKPIGETGPGLYAKVPVPNEGRLCSVAVQLDGEAPVGDLYLSTVDPTFHYDGFFLYVILDNIPVPSGGPQLWRRTAIHGAAYSTNQGTQGFLYLVILGGPTTAVRADIALTVETG
jgi:hypothetical protein